MRLVPSLHHLFTHEYSYCITCSARDRAYTVVHRLLLLFVVKIPLSQILCTRLRYPTAVPVFFIYLPHAPPRCGVSHPVSAYIFYSWHSFFLRPLPTRVGGRSITRCPMSRSRHQHLARIGTKLTADLFVQIRSPPFVHAGANPLPNFCR